MYIYFFHILYIYIYIVFYSHLNHMNNYLLFSISFDSPSTATTSVLHGRGPQWLCLYQTNTTQGEPLRDSGWPNVRYGTRAIAQLFHRGLQFNPSQRALCAGGSDYGQPGVAIKTIHWRNRWKTIGGLFENTKPIIGLNWLRRVGQPSRPRVLRNGKSSCVVCSLNGFLYRRSKQSLIRHSCCLNLVHGTSQSVASGLVESMMQSHGRIPDWILVMASPRLDIHTHMTKLWISNRIKRSLLTLLQKTKNISKRENKPVQ